MIEKMKTYFERLESLSTEELDRSAEKLVRAEKRNVALVIAHIAEISRRKGHLERGYKNLFEYCTRRLNLSEGSVARRIQVANVSRRFPHILVALAENRLSLTVAGLLAPTLTEGNVEKLLSDCEGMTRREVEEYLVALRPKPVFEPSIRRAPTSPALSAALSQRECSTGVRRTNGAMRSLAASTSSRMSIDAGYRPSSPGWMRTIGDLQKTRTPSVRARSLRGADSERLRRRRGLRCRNRERDCARRCSPSPLPRSREGRARPLRGE